MESDVTLEVPLFSSSAGPWILRARDLADYSEEELCHVKKLGFDGIFYMQSFKTPAITVHCWSLI